MKLFFLDCRLLSCTPSIMRCWGHQKYSAAFLAIGCRMTSRSALFHWSNLAFPTYESVSITAIVRSFTPNVFCAHGYVALAAICKIQGNILRNSVRLAKPVDTVLLEHKQNLN